jgi:hypothetical protein
MDFVLVIGPTFVPNHVDRNSCRYQFCADVGGELLFSWHRFAAALRHSFPELNVIEILGSFNERVRIFTKVLLTTSSTDLSDFVPLARLLRAFTWACVCYDGIRESRAICA